jgi:hypothetical protein
MGQEYKNPGRHPGFYEGNFAGAGLIVSHLQNIFAIFMPIFTSGRVHIQFTLFNVAITTIYKDWRNPPRSEHIKSRLQNNWK